MPKHFSVVARSVCMRRPWPGGVGCLCLLFAIAGCGRSDQDRPSTSQTLAQGFSPRFVQVSYATPPSEVTTVSVPFTAAQSAGNLNVVVVGWNDTNAEVASLIDANGNAYQLAVGPTTFPGALTQSIYYAKNIAAAAAGANIVKVSFTPAAMIADVRVLEYSGVDSVNPVDVTAAASGNTARSSTPPLVTTNASDLLFAANTIWPMTTGPATGWTSRVITNPDGDIAEDRIVSTAGSYTATAPLSEAGPWVMQSVAFKAAPASPPPPPTTPTDLVATAANTSEIDVTWTNTSASQTGVKIERSTDNVTFTQIAVAGDTAASYGDTGLTASTTYVYRVRATNAAGDSDYSNVASATTQALPPPPTAPTGLSAAAAGSSQINLSWTNTSTSQTGVEIERSTDNVTFTQIAVAGAAAVSCADTGLSASTTYFYRARATNAAGDSPYSNVASATTPAPPPTATPTLVQHVSSSSNEQNANAGNGFIFNLPNNTGAGNCLILAIAFDSNPPSAVTVSSITDSSGDTWSTTADVTAGDGVNNPFTKIFVHPNASAGLHKMTVTFSDAVTLFQYTMSEFDNVATASPVDVTTNRTEAVGATTASSVTAGSFTPTVSGDLIFAYFTNDAPPFATFPTGYRPMSGWTLNEGALTDCQGAIPHGSEYFVQATAAAINPTMTFTAGGTDTWNGVAVALKSAAAGTPPAAGIRINKILHYANNESLTTYPLLCPSTGNMIVIRNPINSTLTSITDNHGNTYTQAVAAPQYWYADNATTANDLTVTLHFSVATVVLSTHCLDISGAATSSPVDGTIEDPGGLSAPATSAAFDLTDSPAFTPASANGLTIVGLGNGQGPASELAAGSPAGAFYDFVYYTGELDGDRMDNGDGMAHFYNPDTAVEHWGWHIPNVDSTGACDSVSACEAYTYSAIHFKAAPR